MEILSNIKFENMTISDLDNIKDILYTDFDDFWSYNIFKSELENENSKYIVAKLNSEIIGLLEFGKLWTKLILQILLLKRILEI